VTTIKLRKAIGDYKAGDSFTVLDGSQTLHRDGTVTDATGKQLRGRFVDPARAAAWSDAGYLSARKKAEKK
jgi:hypothetical protein